MTEQKIDWSQVAYPVAQKATLSIRDIKPNYNMQFHKDGKQIGMLDWNGPQMVFTGDMEESAKVFFDWVAQSFASRLEQERKAARDWVGLTDEEIDEAQDAAEESFHAMNKGLKPRPLSERASYFDWHLARAIEAKLKDKNGY